MRRSSWPLCAALGYAGFLAIWVLGNWTHDRALLEAVIPWETIPTQLLVVFSLAHFIRDERPGGARGRAWRLVLLGFGLNVAGSALWVQETAAGSFGYGLNDVFFAACICAFAFAAACFFIDLGGSFRRPGVWLDAATLMVALGAMLRKVWVGPAIEAGGTGGWRVGVALVYSFGAAGMLVLCALAYMRITNWRQERSLALLLAGAIASFLADLLWVDVSVRGEMTAASIYQIVYCSGDVLLLAAIVLERRRTEAATRDRRSSVSPTSSVPALAVLVSIAVIVAEQAHEGGFRTMLPLVIAVIGAILVTIREVGARLEIYRSAREAARQEADVRLTELVRRSADAIVVVDAKWLITYASPASERVLGAAPRELIGSDVGALLGEENSGSIAGFVSALERGSREALELEVDFEHPLEHRRVLHVVGSDEGAKSIIGGIALTIRDVTAHRNAERELHELTSRQHAALSHEIHEGLAQELAGISLLVGSIGRGGPAAAEDWAVLQNVPAQLSRAVDNARRLASSLSPLHAADGSLELAVRSLAERIKQSGQLEVHVTSTLGARELPAVLSEEAYRIVLEALECAATDPESSRVDVELIIAAGTLRIRMGWDADPRVSAGSTARGLLRVIGHRARRLRGALLVEESSGRDVRFAVDFPLRAEHAPAAGSA